MFQIKKEDLNMHIFNMITGINKLKIFANYVSCKYKYKFDGKKCNSNQKSNNNKCLCECKNIIYVKKIIFGILTPAVVKMVNMQQILWMIQ